MENYFSVDRASKPGRVVEAFARGALKDKELGYLMDVALMPTRGKVCSHPVPPDDPR